MKVDFRLALYLVGRFRESVLQPPGGTAPSPPLEPEELEFPRILQQERRTFLRIERDTKFFVFPRCLYASRFLGAAETPGAFEGWALRVEYSLKAMGWRSALATAAFSASLLLSVQKAALGSQSVASVSDRIGEEEFQENVFTQALPTPGKFFAHFDFVLRSREGGAFEKTARTSVVAYAISCFSRRYFPSTSASQ